MKHIPTFERFVNEKRVEATDKIILPKLSDADHTRITKWCSANGIKDYKWEKSGDDYIMDTSKMPIRDQQDLDKYLFASRLEYSREFTESTNKSVADILDENEEEVNESIGAIALGVMLAYFGLKVLKVVARSVMGAIGERVELEPAKLKQIVEEVIIKTSAETGTGVGFLQGALLKKELDAKIDSGDIKTMGDIRKFLEDYQKKETK